MFDDASYDFEVTFPIVVHVNQPYDGVTSNSWITLFRRRRPLLWTRIGVQGEASTRGGKNHGCRGCKAIHHESERTGK
jgi:hypothetical protein